MQKTVFILFILFSFSRQQAAAQDTLPRLTVKNINNKIIVSWKMNYGANISTINIQRSKDSLRNFTTIGSVLEPMNRENGYVDYKATSPDMFYRVFVAFMGGTYLFTKSYKPVKDSITSNGLSAIEEDKLLQSEKPTTDLNPVKPTVAKPYVYTPSKFIFTGKENSVIIQLPDAASNQYSVKFFDDKDKPVFEIGKVTEPYLIIEKVNFLHSGWFYFKLFDNGILKEKNQFYIPKEGKTGIPPSEIDRKF